MSNLLKGTSGQTIVDRVTAAKHTISGAGLAKSVCKATTEEIIAPKRKHLEDLVNYTNEPNISIPQMANHLIDRSMNGNWVVVYKSLVTVHHLMCYGNERFTQYLATNNCTFQLNNFMDRATSSGYEMSGFIKRYSNYLNEKALAYRHVGFDFCKVKRGKEGVLRTMNPDKLLKTLPILQNQLDALLNFNCAPGDITNAIVNNCFILLFRDLVRLFACYNDGNMNLLEIYWTLNKKQCKEALELYKNFINRMDKVSDFLRSAEAAGIDKSDIPDITKIPTSLLDSMEQHLAYVESAAVGKKDKSKISTQITTRENDGVDSHTRPANFNDMFAALTDHSQAYNESLARKDKSDDPYHMFDFGVKRYTDSENQTIGKPSPLNDLDATEALREEAERLEQYKMKKIGGGVPPARPATSPNMNVTTISNNVKTTQDNVKKPAVNNIADTQQNKTKDTKSEATIGKTKQQLQQQPIPDIFDSLISLSSPPTSGTTMANENSIQTTQSLITAIQQLSASHHSQMAGNQQFLTPNGFASGTGITNNNANYFSSGGADPFERNNKYNNMVVPSLSANFSSIATSVLSPNTMGNANASIISKPMGKSSQSPNINPTAIVKGDLDGSLANLAASLNIESNASKKSPNNQWKMQSSSSPYKQVGVAPYPNKETNGSVLNPFQNGIIQPIVNGMTSTYSGHTTQSNLTANSLNPFLETAVNSSVKTNSVFLTTPSHSNGNLNSNSNTFRKSSPTPFDNIQVPWSEYLNSFPSVNKNGELTSSKDNFENVNSVSATLNKNLFINTSSSHQTMHDAFEAF